MEEAQQHEKYCPDCGKVFYSAGARCSNCGYRQQERRLAPRVSLADRFYPYRRRLFALLALSTLGWILFCLWRKNPDVVTSALARLRASLQPTPHAQRRRVALAVDEAPRSRRREAPRVTYRAPGEPPVLVAVPALLGLTLEEATERAESRGLELVEHRPRRVSGGFEEGEVFKQSLSPGKRVPSGSVVFVCVAAWQGDPTPAPTPEPMPLGNPKSDVVETPVEEPEAKVSPEPAGNATAQKEVQGQ